MLNDSMRACKMRKNGAADSRVSASKQQKKTKVDKKRTDYKRNTYSLHEIQICDPIYSKSPRVVMRICRS